MKVGVELRGQLFEVELVWDKAVMVDGRTTHAWWLKSINGDPRPRGKDVAVLYHRALELAAQAVRARDQST